MTKYRKRFRKKRYGTRQRTARRTRTLFGNRLCTKLKYQNFRTLDPGVLGTPAGHAYSCNGMWDPDISGGGHQPRGFDQLMNIFNHAVVIGAKITVQVSHTSGVNDTIVGIAIRDNFTIDTNMNNYLESRKCRHVMVGAGANAEPKTISYKLNPNKFLNRSKPMSDPDLKNSAFNNPAESAYFHLFCGPVESVDATPVHCNVMIEYTCVFFEPKLPAQS